MLCLGSETKKRVKIKKSETLILEFFLVIFYFEYYLYNTFPKTYRNEANFDNQDIGISQPFVNTSKGFQPWLPSPARRNPPVVSL